jgi:phosphopantetheine--protein transferase-like protein
VNPPAFGVDVVDLANPRTLGRHHDRRFMERVFAPAERDAIAAAPDPRLRLWRYWAAKEAAFKAIGIRAHPGPPPTFTHTAFQVTEAEAERGTVRWEAVEFAVTFREDRAHRWVGALAVIDDTPDRILPGRAAPDVRWATSDIEETSVRLGARDLATLQTRLGPRELEAARGFAHGLVRLAARTEVARRLGVEANRLEIVNASGPAGRTPPIVHVDDAPRPDALVSLSHDGARIAWATWALSARTGGS